MPPPVGPPPVVRVVCAVWTSLLIELFLVELWVDQFAGLWELQWGTIWLLPSLLSLGALAAVPSWGLWRLLMGRTTLLWGSGVVLCGLLGGVAAWSVSHGRHFEDPLRRAGWLALIATLAAALGWTCARRAPALLGRLPGIAAAGMALAWLLVEAANRWLFVRLYPGFHWSLVGLSLLLVPAILMTAQPFLSRGRERRPRHRARTGIWVMALTLASAAFAPTAARRLQRFDNFRLALSENAPLAGQLVFAASLLAPTAPQDGGDSVEADAAPSGPQEASLDWQGRSILLLSVDALRADHLGSYGYDRPTSPRMDELAASGVLFERAYCATPHTSYSLTSMMTGKFMRPLLLQELGADSETWATLLRTYGYRTAAFYPPAVFFIDKAQFLGFEQSGFGFEYQKKEFLEGAARVQQVENYLHSVPEEQPLMTWVHLFSPHEPYEAHPGHSFGPRDLDLYDGEIAATDGTAGAIVDAFRRARPDSVVIITADHGEEFGDHGGRYHGSSVYEEQVRVPLIISAPGLAAKRIQQPVQTVDLLPTVLSALRIPVRPRIRGKDLGPLMRGGNEEGEKNAPAFSETEQHTLLAQDSWRLVCARRIGACQLFDLTTDPVQQRDVSTANPRVFADLKRTLNRLNGSHGSFERRGLRAEGGGWPPALLRGIAGDADAALEVAALLDDADLAVRRKSAETLFELRAQDAAPALRLALQRGDDDAVKSWAALALARLGQGAPLVVELLDSPERAWRRLAALVLAENGDRQGRHQLIEWWMNKEPRSEQRSLEILAGLQKIRAQEAVWPLTQQLDQVRLRPAIAKTLAAIGDPAARGPLAKAFRTERYYNTRVALAEALAELGADNELVKPLRRWLAAPDPLSNGLQVAEKAGILAFIGGPKPKELRELRRQANWGVQLHLQIPKSQQPDLRILVLAENTGREAGRVLVGKGRTGPRYDKQGKRITPRNVPEIHPSHRVALEFPAHSELGMRWGTVPSTLELRPGKPASLVVFAERGIKLHSLAILPLREEPEPGSGALPRAPQEAQDPARRKNHEPEAPQKGGTPAQQ